MTHVQDVRARAGFLRGLGVAAAFAHAVVSSVGRIVGTARRPPGRSSACRRGRRLFVHVLEPYLVMPGRTRLSRRWLYPYSGMNS